MESLLLALSLVPAAVPVDTCSRPVLLPAYAHNDYRNQHPFWDALSLGYRGVEADVFRVRGELLVGHDRQALRSARTLARLYLEPLRDRRRACGHVVDDTLPFLLTIDLKQRDSTAFRLLIAQLRQYAELFQPPDSGSHAPVQVTLVGWWPAAPADSSWPRFLRVHVPVTRTTGASQVRSGAMVGLVTIDYGKALKWSGRGVVPSDAKQVLVAARQIGATYGVPVRVHHVPVREEIYRWLCSEGVALIGVDHLTQSREVLRRVSVSFSDAH